ncbi:hypothetical protein JOW62_27880 [Escherichia coli]|uniref:hypothetical protein n=2 Tax=Escherichia coli TaxID=562 RepID=UPI000E1D1801|nr:hypothetical protein [Escherichia coli]EFE3929245.1 hypothetical protein [Escherichia coli]EFF6681665.1 hypothetical protein [Escherichia coli]EFJ4444318.1 hypothetical protein [Escherichia coli]EHD4838312.1 hypothetical protein [Escherichia coli]EHI0300588.1 hypothetical protein [Escherichia coli]
MRLIETLPMNYSLGKYESWKNQWSDKSLLDFSVYISEEIHPEDFLISSRLFFPDFIEVNDCVFLSGRYVESNYNDWMEKLKSKSSVESILNHVNIYDIFSGKGEEVPDSIFIQIANVLKFSWEVSLAKCFLNKRFVVEASFSDMEYGPTLTFYQDR